MHAESGTRESPAPTVRAAGIFRSSWIRRTTVALVCVAAVVGGVFAYQLGFAQRRGKAPVQPVTVVNEYPHDPAAYTQGLVFHDGGFYESTGQYGESTLRRVDLETGEVLRSVPLGRRYFGEGLALWNDHLLQLTWKARVGFVYDREAFLERGAGPVARVRYTGQGWGLAHDGERFVMSDGSSILRFLDPKTFRVTRRLRVTDAGRPVDDLNELEYVEGEILANVWYSDHVARIDPETGRVTAWLDCGHLFPPRDRRDRDQVLNGIAYDAEKKRLFVTGKNWPKLFEIRVEK